ncbi:InlB B-repeat-containing protein [Faecalibaculum rodentium]|uniref:InlB B-repeat-containing protein n=6 Tax=Faecalibaculum rodentium TaxID=1702221 RepID=UPI00272A1831|nr:hypothetical protein [Faecalibaculum rodentium]
MKKTVNIVLSALVASSAFTAIAVNPVQTVFAEEIQQSREVEASATFLSGIGGSFAGGSTSITVNSGSSLDNTEMIGSDRVPDVIVRPGYEFKGWMMDGLTNRLYSKKYFDMILFTGHHVFEAVYDVLSFNLSFSAGEHGSFTNPETAATRSIPVDQPMGDFPAITPEQGYVFTGWKVSGTVYSPEAAAQLLMPADAVTATAVYEPETAAVSTVRFESGEHASFEQDAVTTAEVETGSCLKESQIPAVTPAKGYEFIGWTDGNRVYSSQDLLALPLEAQAVTFTAVCEKKEGTRRISVTFHAGEHGQLADGSMQLVHEEILEGASLAGLEIPEPIAREGWTFAGWTLNTQQTILSADEIRQLTAGRENMVFTAVYEKKTGTASPADRDESVKPSDKTDGKTEGSGSKAPAGKTEKKTAVPTSAATGAALFAAAGTAAAGLFAGLIRRKRSR